ncbi:hypothetical protein [Peribacillus asahii]|uniref:hypothetical protein n=1 Tax=Peribacillus asahii TaxID=228899 RepID=UPI003806CED9
MTTKIKQVNLNNELEKCKNDDGIMIKIPIFKTVKSINGELVGELEGYINAPNTVDYSNKRINRQKYTH